MNKILNTSKWLLFGSLSIMIGLYPILYFIIDRHFGLLSSKSQDILNNVTWNYAFYGHIILGGVALLIGWTQFSSRLRRKHIKVHRTIGKLYLLSVLISGLCGIYIAQYATGGITNVIGFTLSALVWLSTSILAFKAIRAGKIQLHKEFMIYSYSVCFSAVTLRIWLPLLIFLTGDFISAYLIVGWLSWVPNLIVAYFIILRERNKLQTQPI
ncbi:DUF2306 domain-containing protein [Gramella lutea]|uniref:DUF2306 domain-containing protein n=1 Tax=Christiangramia lutea TaxID=1607951 RepID=A0A9X1V5C6_9FLAO|nr:DUF2306 domain-containing protein [Christiangramia lutea]MCH4824401.1 DUF2306 domain-containing protein [Christiangramia lutea]